MSGKVVLVTGASRGIGRAIAEACGDSGATVAVHYSRSREAAEALAASLGNEARAIQADLSDPPAAQHLWEDCLNTFGHVDVLINNAGIAESNPADAPLDNWIASWRRTMDTNLTSVGVLCRAAVAHFIERRGGRIINIASRAAFRGDSPDYLAYAASKAGVVALTRSIARAYGKHGISAFTIAPGFTKTDMAQPFIEMYGEGYASDDLALPRMTEPADIAPLVVLLASGLADPATGATIDVNAGSYVH